MLKETVFHEDVFDVYFLPFRHPSSHFNIWGGLGLETFGKDLQLVKSLDPNCIWTVVDGAAGVDMCISPGVHHVNRICYLTTRRPHFDAPITFRSDGGNRPITSVGLARRLVVSQKLMAAHQRGSRLAY